MRDHVIRMEKVPNQGSCRVLCFIEPNCVSINFGPKRKGIHKCELNNATEESQTVAGLHKKMNYIYLGIEVKCLNVKFQCTQFSCRIALSVHDSLTALLFLLDIILCVFLLALSANPNSVFGHSQDSVRHISKHRQKIDKNTPPRTIFSTIFSVFGKWSINGSFCVWYISDFTIWQGRRVKCWNQFFTPDFSATCMHMQHLLTWNLLKCYSV